MVRKNSKAKIPGTGDKVLLDIRISIIYDMSFSQRFKLWTNTDEKEYPTKGTICP
jgi:hypothetical protein